MLMELRTLGYRATTYPGALALTVSRDTSDQPIIAFVPSVETLTRGRSGGEET